MADDDSIPNPQQPAAADAEKERPAGQAPVTPGTGGASAGIPSGGAPSTAVSAGSVPEDEQEASSPGGPAYGEQTSRVVPGQPPGPAVPPVPSPGAVGVSAPGVATGQAASPEDGIHAADKAPDSDASVSSPASWTSLPVPGKPDGEVDTRSR